MARLISTPRNMVLRNDVIHTTQSSLRTCMHDIANINTV
jgi:hypothetical protein